MDQSVCGWTFRWSVGGNSVVLETPGFEFWPHQTERKTVNPFSLKNHFPVHVYTLNHTTNRWFSAKLQYLQCVSNGDTTALHQAIEIFLHQIQQVIPMILSNEFSFLSQSKANHEHYKAESAHHREMAARGAIHHNHHHDCGPICCGAQPSYVVLPPQPPRVVPPPQPQWAGPPPQGQWAGPPPQGQWAGPPPQGQWAGPPPSAPPAYPPHNCAPNCCGPHCPYYNSY